MDPSGVRSWVHHSQRYMHPAAAAFGFGFTSPRLAGAPPHGAALPLHHPMAVGLPISATSPPAEVRTNEPLDLRIKRDENSPLDLSVSRGSPSGSVSTNHSLFHNSGSPASVSTNKGSATPSSMPNTQPVFPGVRSRSSASSSSEHDPKHHDGFASARSPPSARVTNAHLSCSICPYTTINPVDLQCHLVYDHHSVGPHNLQPRGAAGGLSPLGQHQPMGELLHCSYCGFQCPLHRSQEFHIHLTRHRNNSRQYKCHHCDKHFPEQTALREHLLIHPTLNHYICSMCSVAFGTQALFASHVSRSHNSSQRTPSAPAPAPTLLKPAPRKPATYIPAVDQGKFSPNTAADRVSGPQSPLNSSEAGATTASTGETPSTVSEAIPNPTLGQCLARQIENAISHQIAGGKTPSLSDVMFMQTDKPKDESTCTSKGRPCCEAAQTKKNPLNLMSLLDKVVEETLRADATGMPPSKPDLKFTVTFSDEEDEPHKECDSTVVNNGSAAAGRSSGSPPGRSEGAATKTNEKKNGGKETSLPSSEKVSDCANE